MATLELYLHHNLFAQVSGARFPSSGDVLYVRESWNGPLVGYSVICVEDFFSMDGGQSVGCPELILAEPRNTDRSKIHVARFGVKGLVDRVVYFMGRKSRVR